MTIQTKTWSKVQELESLGFKLIGQGSRAMVLTPPGDETRAIRIAHYDRSEVHQEDGWLHYIETFGKSGLLHVPEVHSVFKHADYYVATMERLFKSDNITWPHSAIMYEKWPEFAKFADWLKFGYERPFWCEFDGMCMLGSANVMVRSNGTPIVNDPFYTPHAHRL